VKVRDLIKVVEGDGWYLSRQRGSHRQFHHPAKPGCVTVLGHLFDDVPKGTLVSIMRRSGLKRRGQ
jgi:predicted RNA binding protein YcfA (HicA-like mRNA interferase family)